MYVCVHVYIFTNMYFIHKYIKYILSLSMYLYTCKVGFRNCVLNNGVFLQRQCLQSTILCLAHSKISNCQLLLFFFYFFIYYLFIIFIFGCVGSSFLCEGFLQLWRVGATLHRGARASHHRGLSCCGAQAPDAQAQ